MWERCIAVCAGKACDLDWGDGPQNVVKNQPLYKNHSKFPGFSQLSSFIHSFNKHFQAPTTCQALREVSAGDPMGNKTVPTELTF